MATTDNFRKQHHDVLDVVQTLERLLDPAIVMARSADARSLLNSLLGKLSIHFAMEDKSLYPRLEQHAVPAVRETAKRFAAEMGGIKPLLAEFGRKWTDAAIKSDGAAFCVDAKKLFAALRERIQREDTQLYRLADENA